MRCPKCHYISFDAGERCRNCGYEFSLAVDFSGLDLAIQKEPEGPMADFGFAGTPQPASDGAGRPRARTTGFDLPLFKDRAPDDDAPLVTPPAVPRPPLSVRKASPAVARAPQRARTEEPELDLGVLEPAPQPASRHAIQPSPSTDLQGDTGAVPASLARRFGAAVIDAFVLGTIDVAVLYFTLRLCGLQLNEIAAIPAVPFVAFLLMQNGGYFAAFVAAGGQTIGKMVFSIKVVPAEPRDGWSDRVPFGTAVLRAVLWFLTVLPAGIGLLPAVFSTDHRAVHDRLADTRVVKA